MGSLAECAALGYCTEGPFLLLPFLLISDPSSHGTHLERSLKLGVTVRVSRRPGNAASTAILASPGLVFVLHSSAPLLAHAMVHLARERGLFLQRSSGAPDASLSTLLPLKIPSLFTTLPVGGGKRNQATICPDYRTASPSRQSFMAASSAAQHPLEHCKRSYRECRATMQDWAGHTHLNASVPSGA